MKNTQQHQPLRAELIMPESNPEIPVPYKAWIPEISMVHEEKSPGFGFVLAQLLSDRSKPVYADLLGHPELPDPSLMSEEELEQELNILLGKLALNRVVIDDCDEFSTGQVYEFIRNTLMDQEVHTDLFPGAWYHLIISEHEEQDSSVDPHTLEFLKMLFSHDWRFLNSFINKKILIDGISYVPDKSDDLRMKMMRKFNCSQIEKVHLLEKYRHNELLTEVIDIELRFPKTKLLSYVSRIEVESGQGPFNRIIRKLNGLFNAEHDWRDDYL